MEKYSRWRDPGTGIQPFLPPVPPRTDSSLLATLSNVIHIIVGPIQGLVKLVLVGMTALLYVLFVPLLGTLLTPLGPLKRAWNRLFSAVFLRLILFLCGFLHIKTETISVRKSRNGPSTASGSIKSGSVIVTNSTSYIEVLYLASCNASSYNPMFVQVYTDSDKVKPITLWQAVRSTGRMPTSAPKDETLYSVKELSRLAKQKHLGPIVVFAEGTTTNGRALLQFAPLFKDYAVTDKDGDFHIMAFKYDYGNMPPTFTVGNQFYHFFRLCSQFHNSLNVKTLAQGEAPCSGNTTVDMNNSNSSNEDPVGHLLISALGNISKLRKTGLRVTDKCDFLSYYESRQQKK
ncbi:hypothetical protein K501DRAFT_293046 [Backusella circina FSU 941]|nr:hypothetical protein K501DRAFT_293046 [Backusella circina FSU 941]